MDTDPRSVRIVLRTLSVATAVMSGITASQAWDYFLMRNRSWWDVWFLFILGS